MAVVKQSINHRLQRAILNYDKRLEMLDSLTPVPVPPDTRWQRVKDWCRYVFLEA